MSETTAEARPGDHAMKTAVDARRRFRSGAALIVVALLAASFYGTRLDKVPPYLHHDEIFVGLLGHAIAESGRDLSGRFLPLYFQIPSTVNWYPPIVVYSTAAWLSVLPLSDVAVRLPNVCVGVLSVVLMYLVARRVCRHDGLGLLAAALLAVTPAHFIQSRISTDSLYPVVFVLAWLFCLVRFLEQPGRWRVFFATSVLGIGVYSYIASVVMMPLYLAMTLAILLWDRHPMRHVVFAAAGFAWPVLLGAAFLAQHPEILGDFSTKYSLSGQADLNPLQQLREALTSWNISDRLNLFHSFFDPGYLFVTGGTNIAHSTRQAGVFLAPMAAFMTVGAYDAISRPTPAKTIALAGFLTAPAAAVIVSESYAIPRELSLYCPFGVLLATLGVVVMWRARMSRSPRPIAVTLALGLLMLGIGYSARMLIGDGRISGPAVVLILAGGTMWVVGRECERRSSWKPVAACLLLLIPIQFYFFQLDYLGDYRARSAGRYGHNLRGAIEELIALRDRTSDAEVYLNHEIPYVRDYWEFYLKMHRRTDLLARATTLDTKSDILGDIRSGSLLLTDTSERALAVFGGRSDFVQVGSANDPAGGDTSRPGPTTFIIYQKR